jgi:MFS family permease
VNRRVDAFRIFWLAQAISRFGDPITLIALATLSYQLTNSAFFTALAVLITTGPVAIFGFFVGAVGDALGYRRALLISDLARVVLVGAIPVAMQAGAPLAAAYVLVFCAAIFTAIFNPARMAIIPELVAVNRLGSANSAIASTDRVVEIIGALAAGFLVASFGRSAFYVDAVTFAISALLVSFIRGTPGSGRFSVGALFRDAAEGLRFLIDSPVLRPNTVFSLVAQLSAPVANGLTPVFLVRRFAGGDPAFGAVLFGIAEAALAAGAVAAGLTLPDYLRRYKKGRLLIIGFAGYGALLILLALAPSLLPALVLFFFLGVLNIVYFVPNVTISQEVAPPNMRARIFGARITLVQLSWLPVIVLTGLVADRLDVGWLFVGAGVVTLGTALFAARFVPAVSEVA